MRPTARLVLVCLAVLGISVPAQQAQAPRPNQDSQPPRTTQKPPLHGRQWMAVTGKPLGATAGAMIFQQGGNAIDAACAMLAAVHDVGYARLGRRNPGAHLQSAHQAR
jgi:hypothetical protein